MENLLKNGLVELETPLIEAKWSKFICASYLNTTDHIIAASDHILDTFDHI